MSPEIKNEFGHNLEKLTTETIRQFRLKPPRTALATQLHNLNNLYSKHLLRYSSSYDILVDPSTIQSELIFSRVVAVVVLADRLLDK